MNAKHRQRPAEPTTAADRHKLDPAERRTLEQATRARDTIRRFLNGDPDTDPPRTALSDDTIADLIRRAREPADDAFTTGNGGPGNDVSDPTLSAILREAGGRIVTDPDTGEPVGTPDQWRQLDDQVRAAILNILGALSEAAGVLDVAAKRRAYVDDIATKAYGRTNQVELCAGCNEPALRVKRLDGQPYHHPDPVNGESQPQCWWAAYRASRPPQEASDT